VPECTRQNLVSWRILPTMTSTAAKGIANAKMFEKDLVGKLLKKAQPRLFGAVQADTLWCESERQHLRPGHFWLFEFGDAGGGSVVEKSFELVGRSSVDYKGTCFYNGQHALKVKRWFHRTDYDASGCTFVPWDPTKDAAKDAPPVELLINSSKLRAVFSGEHLKQLVPPPLESAARMRTRRGAAVTDVQGVGDIKHLMNATKDEEIRATCVAGSSLR